MAYVNHQGLKLSLKCGTAAISPFQSVALDSSGGGDVVAIATNNVRPLGVTIATVTASQAAAVYAHDNVVKAIAAASLGVGAEVGVASTNGNFGPITGASGVTKWATGRALTAAAAGERFSLLVQPRQLSNLI
jgi:hypothetical protein